MTHAPALPKCVEKVRTAAGLGPANPSPAKRNDTTTEGETITRRRIKDANRKERQWRRTCRVPIGNLENGQR